MEIELIPVESSNIAAIGFELGEGGKGVLRIEFMSGSQYDYADVPAKLFEDLLASESVGRFFNQSTLRRFDGKKYEGEEAPDEDV